MGAEPAGLRACVAAAGGVVWVGLGLGVYGLASFAFLSVAGRALGDGAQYTALALVWTLLNAVGIGLYLPVEQESGRALAARAARALPLRPALVPVLLYGGGSLVVLAGALLAARGPLTSGLFEGVGSMPALLLAALAGMALAYLVRGVLAGTGRYPRYGVQLCLDGLLRVGGAFAVAATAAPSGARFALVLVLAPVLSSLAVARRDVPVVPGPWRDGTPARSPLALLVGASLASQALANAGPVAVQLLRGPGDEASAGGLVNALTVARLPLFVFAAVQAVLLPRLAGRAARDDGDGFRADLALVVRVTAALGVAGVLGAAVVGPAAVRALFGPSFAVPTAVVMVLAASAAAFMLAQVAVQALLARRRDRAALVAWVAGLAAAALALVLPLELGLRVSWALAVGGGVAAVVAALAVRRELRRWPAVPADAPAPRPGAVDHGPRAAPVPEERA